MELFKTKGMKALSVSLIAAAALIVTVIVIAFSGASRSAKKPPDETTGGTAQSSGAPTADLVAGDPSEGTTDESGNGTETTSEATDDADVTTEEIPSPPALAFLSNGDGTCTLTGLGTYKKTEVDVPTLSPTGDVVTSVAGYAFYNETSLVRISLPSTIRSIGEYAFFGCSNLIELTVSKSNTAFTVIDGILYSKDGSRLLYCPPMRGKTTCTIGKNVSVIESGAFSGVKYLKTIYYEGTAADYTEINVFAHNELLDKLRLVCNYVEEK